MAKGKKAEQRRQKARGLDRETYMGFMADVAEKKQELDDTKMSHAGAWKKAEALGIHPDVAKLFAKLDRYEPTKLADWLRSFDKYRPWYEDWTAQPDLWDDQPTESAGAEQEDREDGDGDEPGLDLDQRETAAAGDPEPPPDTEAVLREQEEADPVDETPAEATEELAGAGYTFEAGRGNALAGNGAELNPHPASSPSRDIWARGHAQGLKDKAAAESEAESQEGAADTVTQISTRRGRRAAAEPASVH